MLDMRDYDAQRPAGHFYEFDSHSYRVAYLMDIFAQFLGWGEDIANMLYWATLPHDMGKMALPVAIWDSVSKPSAAEKALRRTHVSAGLSMVKDELSDEVLAMPFAKLLILICWEVVAFIVGVSTIFPAMSVIIMVAVV